MSLDYQSSFQGKMISKRSSADINKNWNGAQINFYNKIIQLEAQDWFTIDYLKKILECLIEPLESLRETIEDYRSIYVSSKA